MTGREELEQLAHLLRRGASMAREIAADRLRGDYREVARLSRAAESIADRLDGIVRKRVDEDRSMD